MTADLTAAVDQMSALFYAAWQANAGAVFGYVPEIEWYGREAAAKIDRTKVWVRFSTQNVMDEQASLSTCVGAPFQRRYQSSGLVFIQLFIPKTVANGVVLGRELAKVARNAFRGKATSGGVKFFNARINDNVAPEELLYRINVVAEYDFDELG